VTGSYERRAMQPPLTDRQQRVLHGVCDGMTNKEIGDGLGVSEGAVKATVQQLFRRARVRTRAQLVRIAIESALGTPRFR
jgi:two-component system, NarL family, nitrate/nitrite response regulator NarL